MEARHWNSLMERAFGLNRAPPAFAESHSLREKTGAAPRSTPEKKAIAPMSHESALVGQG